jgi:phospholipid/cholesterol/gamma-HCH transport system substrate-binding protein
MSRSQVETMLGAMVIAVAAILLVFAYTTADIRRVQGYTISMRFDRIDGLRLGADVRMSGIKIGSVTQQTLDPETYLAVVTVSIDPSVKLPVDTSAEISTEGLMGDKFLALVAGGSEEMLPPGGMIEYTQGSVDLVGLISRLMSDQTGREKDAGGQDGSQPGSAK